MHLEIVCIVFKFGSQLLTNTSGMTFGLIWIIPNGLTRTLQTPLGTQVKRKIGTTYFTQPLILFYCWRNRVFHNVECNLSPASELASMIFYRAKDIYVANLTNCVNTQEGLSSTYIDRDDIDISHPVNRYFDHIMINEVSLF